jgi:hypothetical protein
MVSPVASLGLPWETITFAPSSRDVKGDRETATTRREVRAVVRRRTRRALSGTTERNVTALEILTPEVLTTNDVVWLAEDNVARAGRSIDRTDRATVAGVELTQVVL